MSTAAEDSEGDFHSLQDSPDLGLKRRRIDASAHRPTRSSAKRNNENAHHDDNRKVGAGRSAFCRVSSPLQRRRDSPASDLELEDDTADEMSTATAESLELVSDDGVAVGQFRSSGTLRSIELRNFMCHGHWKGEFINAVNFVIGNNGSGKSSVLTALSVVLGARATTTNRAKSLSQLVRQGAKYDTMI